MAADLVIYAVVAAGLVFWLRNILGTRHDGESSRHNPYNGQPDPAEKQQNSQGDTVGAPGFVPSAAEDMSAGLERHMSIENENAERGISEIARTDRAFVLPHFLKGAQDAFVMIIEAFAASDKETLQGLLSDPVYKAFESVINDRAAKGEQGSVEIHSVRKCEVIDAQIKDKMAFITVRFTADETSIVKNKEGDVIFGDPDRITETIDIWTFGKSLRSRDPVWLVYETREHEDDELSGSTVPETGQ